MDSIRKSLKLANLSKREMEILRLVLAGNTSKQIAQILDISHRTVEAHRSNLMRRLNVSNVVQLADVIFKGVREVEDRLLMIEGRLQEAQKIAQLGSWTFDLNSGSTVWSDEMYRILGYLPGSTQPSYSTFLSHVLPDHRDKLEPAFLQILSGKDVYDDEYQIVSNNGETRYIKAQDTVEWNVAGDPVRIFGTVIDVTSTKMLELELEKSRKRVDQLFHHAPAGIHVLNEKGEYVDVNETELEMLGHEKAEVVGRKFSDFTTDEGKELFGQQFPLLLEHGHVHGLAYELICKDGQHIHVLLNEKAIHDAQGNFVESYGVMFKLGS